eukprot:CAMPEP_0115515080 /NCGR_PEP_ID=MMETSP0271-20121206/76019_1 /TAXON_ID=71861 /ORGANISM="Scrippsiella trochoidea, Strain CCMP3099" /LENGTH=209 /DNA_ID=CAMNT_0002945615 /DNA_START=1 /DNA_END=625 /DNA_ORIENTATION=-
MYSGAVAQSGVRSARAGYVGGMAGGGGGGMLVGGGGAMGGAAGGSFGGAGVAGGGCSMAACGIEEEEGPTVMAYVGGGCGDYVQETTYKFVGCGAGEFELMSQKKANYTCLYCGGCVGLVGLILVLLLIFAPGPVSSTTTPLTTMLPYDCAAGLPNWKAGWSIAKKVWCCQNAGKGCEPPPHAAPDATAAATAHAATSTAAHASAHAAA